jgi:SAM-dependent methyltransferase
MIDETFRMQIELRTLPIGTTSVPDYEGGWLVGNTAEPFLRYVGDVYVNWSESLESLHEESSRDHFLDVATRASLIRAVSAVTGPAVIADLGCSTGYLLEDLRAAHPTAMLVGVDLVPSGLRKAHTLVPTARLLLADACDLPLGTDTVDALVSANLLEHIPDDRGALLEIKRVLREKAPAALVVPAGPRTFDYYDRYLGHERRYARGELAGKARSVGLEVVADRYIASLLYPAFWMVKRRNRIKYGSLEGSALELRVEEDIDGTKNSRLGAALIRLEEKLDLRLPFGIRNLVIVRHP